MSSEQTEAEIFNTDYLRMLLDETAEPYASLAERAQELELYPYHSQLLTERRKISTSTGARYLSNISSGLVPDKALAHELALTENDFVIARRKIGGLAIEPTIKDSLLETLTNDLAAKHAEQFRNYVKLGRKFIDSYILSGEPQPLEPLEPYTDKQLEKCYDTSPINKSDLASTGAYSQAVGRAWNGFVQNAGDNIYLFRDGVRTEGPRIKFLSHDDSQREWSDQYSDLDFKSFYNAVRWVHETITANPKVSPSDLLGRGVGQQTLTTYRQLITLRKK